MWKDFETKFDGVLKSLQRHKELIEARASLSHYRIYRDDMAEMRSKLDELIDGERGKKMRTVKEWLAVGPQQEDDHNSFRAIRKEFPSTGRWILNQESVKE